MSKTVVRKRGALGCSVNCPGGRTILREVSENRAWPVLEKELFCSRGEISFWADSFMRHEYIVERIKSKQGPQF